MYIISSSGTENSVSDEGEDYILIVRMMYMINSLIVYKCCYFCV